MGCCLKKESKRVAQAPNDGSDTKKDIKDILDGSQMEEEKGWISPRKGAKDDASDEEVAQTDKAKMESTLSKPLSGEKKDKDSGKKRRSNSMIEPNLDNNITLDERTKSLNKDKNVTSPRTEKKYDKEEGNLEEKAGTFISDTQTLNKTEVKVINERSKQLEEQNENLKNENEELKRKLTLLIKLTESEKDVNPERISEALNLSTEFKFELSKPAKKSSRRVLKVKNQLGEDPMKKRQEYIQKIIEDESNELNYEVKLTTEGDEEEEQIQDTEKEIEHGVRLKPPVKQRPNIRRGDEDTVEAVKRKSPKKTVINRKSQKNFQKIKKSVDLKVEGEKEEEQMEAEEEETPVQNIEDLEDEDPVDYHERKINMESSRLNPRSQKRDFLLEKFESEEKLQEYLDARKDPVLTPKQMQNYKESKESKPTHSKYYSKRKQLCSKMAPSTPETSKRALSTVPGC